MGERKVSSKYYSSDFDPNVLTRQRKHHDIPKKLNNVTLMSPFSMRCTTCGEYIYRGRKFNARKQLTNEKYYAIPIFRFFVRCTACSAEIAFKTDPKNMDYECERGAKRNFEPWRKAKLAEETEGERLDRLEREEAERDTMAELEAKAMDAKMEMAVANGLDTIMMRNARRERAMIIQGGIDTQRQAASAEENDDDDKAARKAFRSASGECVRRLPGNEAADPPGVSVLTFQRAKKRKTNFVSGLGIRQK